MPLRARGSQFRPQDRRPASSQSPIRGVRTRKRGGPSETGSPDSYSQFDNRLWHLVVSVTFLRSDRYRAQCYLICMQYFPLVPQGHLVFGLTIGIRSATSFGSSCALVLLACNSDVSANRVAQSRSVIPSVGFSQTVRAAPAAGALPSSSRAASQYRSPASAARVSKIPPPPANPISRP
jgi:hypothetical protein